MSGAIDKIQGKAGQLAKTDIGKGMLQGAGIAAFGAVKNAAFGALDAVVDFGKGSVDAAIEEEQGIAALTASLRASIAGWDGNTEAIERGVSARMRFGYTDDDLRESLTRLLPITKDVGEAQRVQAAAMDLARFKGIGLVDASLAIGKAMSGNKRMLKELGIAVDEAATAEQTLASVQKAVSGQAEAYAKTAAGRIAAASAQIAQAQGDLGAKALDAGQKVAMGLDYIFWDYRKAGYSEASLDNYADWMAKLARTAAATAAIIEGDLYGATVISGDSMAELGAAARAAGHGLDATTGAILAVEDPALSAAAALDRVTGAYNTLTGSLDRQHELENLPLQIQTAVDKVADLKRDLAKETDPKAIRAIRLQLKEAADEVERLRLLLHLKTPAASSGETGTGGAKGYVGPERNAAGGYVAPYGLSLVGENGPELVRAGSSGMQVTPSLGSGGGSGGSPVTLSVQLDGREIARVVDRHLYYRAARAPQSPYAS